MLQLQKTSRKAQIAVLEASVRRSMLSNMFYVLMLLMRNSLSACLSLSVSLSLSVCLSVSLLPPPPPLPSLLSLSLSCLRNCREKG